MTDERTGNDPGGPESGRPPNSQHSEVAGRTREVTRRRDTLATVLAAGVFTLAWFLPVVAEYTPEHAGPPGWDAFLAALGVGNDSSVLGVTSALTNGLMIAALALLQRPQLRVPRWTAWVMVIAVVLNSTWAWPPAKVAWLREGYWLWEASFGFVAILMLHRSRAPTSS